MTGLNKNYVITGGPCAGKTAVINALRDKGFIIVPEAARLVKRRSKIYGGPLPEDKFDEFEAAVLKAQKKLILKYPGSLRFHDRSYCDNIAYYRFNKKFPPPELMSTLHSQRFDKVFYLSQLGFYNQDGGRPETKTEADFLHKLVWESYAYQGYSPIEVPLMSVAERIAFIIKQIKEDVLKLGVITNPGIITSDRISQ